MRPSYIPSYISPHGILIQATTINAHARQRAGVFSTLFGILTRACMRNENNPPINADSQDSPGVQHVERHVKYQIRRLIYMVQ